MYDPNSLKMSKSTVSIIIPTYNRAHFLNRAITSALIQMVKDDELIVIDDGSTDNTQTLVKRYGKRIRYIRTLNMGAGAARNLGIKESRNPLLAFLDSDDEWMPGKLKLQRAFMRARTDILFCFSNFIFKEADNVGGKEKRFNLVSWSKDTRSWNEILGPGFPISTEISLPPGVNDFNYYPGNLYLLELSANYINVNTLMIRKKEAENALYFAEDTKTYEDWEFFGRISRAGNSAYLDIETACQHSHGGPRLTDSHETDCAEARIKIIQRVWGEDEDFIANHGGLYQRVLDEQRLILADGLIARGETKKAREQLCKMTALPLSRCLLAALPGTATMRLLAVRRICKNFNIPYFFRKNCREMPSDLHSKNIRSPK